MSRQNAKIAKVQAMWIVSPETPELALSTGVAQAQDAEIFIGLDDD